MVKMRAAFICAATAALLALAVTTGFHGDGEAARRDVRPAPQAPLVLDSQKHIDANLVDMFVSNVGTFAWDLVTQDPGLTYPKGTNKQAIFAAGLWVGAVVGGERRVEVAEYSAEYVPGRIVGGTFDPSWPSNQQYHVYKVNRGDTDANPDYRDWPVDHGAPFEVVNGDTIPKILGDQMLWCVYNDMDPNAHQNNAGKSLPLGLEIQQSTFAFDRQDALANVVFLSFKFINKGANTLEDAYVSVWSDPDLGDAGDDLVGCDTTLSLGYCYNGTNTDGIYGSTPPAVGFDFFRGPRVVQNGDTTYLPMTSYIWYPNGGDPSSAEHSYNFMLGLNRDGTPVIDPNTNEPSKFFVPGDPVTNTGWLDSNPSDRRFMLTSGPFTMAPGDTQEVVTAIVLGLGQDRLTSVTAMKFNDRFAQDAFDKNFVLPNPPPGPEISLTELDGEIVLSWGDVSETNSDEPGYAFEGYIVYQGASVAGPWKRITTYDIDNATGIIFDDQFDLESGVVINKPVQFGSDSGVKRYITLDQDYIRGGPLRNGKEYYFSVTSYSYGAERTPKTLENAIQSQAVLAVPQAPVAGTRLGAGAPMDTIPAPHVLGGSDGVVYPLVLDPRHFTGHDYRVNFRSIREYDPAIEDTVSVTVWDLLDVDADSVMVTGFRNQSGDEDYPILDGLVMKVLGPPLEGKDWNYALADTSHLRWFTRGEGAGGELIAGGGYLGPMFNGSAVAPGDFKTVEVRWGKMASFTDTNGNQVFDVGEDYVVDTSAEHQLAYMYQTWGADRSGLFEVPFTAWDVEANPARQLNVILRDRNDNHLWDLHFLSEDETVDTQYNYLFIMDSTYDPTGAAYTEGPALINFGADLDVQWVLWLGQRSDPDTDVPIPVLSDEGVLTLEPNRVNTPADVFEFSPAAPTVEKADAKADLQRILVVPNPYLNRSTYEFDQFDRRVKFTNLPAKCTIRIFNLAGDLVRTLPEKTDPTTSQAEWDLLTENGIPVASGIFIWHVDAPGVGERFGKMAVFVEKERLNTY